MRGHMIPTSTQLVEGPILGFRLETDSTLQGRLLGNRAMSRFRKISIGVFDAMMNGRHDNLTIRSILGARDL